MYSIFFSNSGINDLPRWQFYNTTHEPVFNPLSIADFALGPCPYPRDIIENLS